MNCLMVELRHGEMEADQVDQQLMLIFSEFPSTEFICPNIGDLMNLQDIHKEILTLCVDDYTGLWLVVRSISKDAYPLDAMPKWVRQQAIQVIEDLLRAGLIEAGNFEPKSFEFQTITLTTDETINYIQHQWDELGRAPTIGDVCWFQATAAGEQLAQQILASQDDNTSAS